MTDPDDYLLLARWEQLNTEQKGQAVVKATAEASAVARKKLDTVSPDYYQHVILALMQGSGARVLGDHLEWWMQIKNSAIYQRDERVKAFNASIKMIKSGRLT